MSKLSKTFLIASPVLFFLAFAIHQCRLWNLQSELVAASEGAVDMLVHFYATGWDIWDDIILFSIVAGFACIFCAILVWKRDRPHQKLFPE